MSRFFFFKTTRQPWLGLLALSAWLFTTAAHAQTFIDQTGAANPFNGVDVGAQAAPSLGDLDGDGDFDVLVGEVDGVLNYFKNTGTTAVPVYVFQTGSDNPFDGVDVGFLATPSLGDVDGDGDLDAVVGESLGVVFYFRNTGTRTAPVFTRQTGGADPFDNVDAGDDSNPSLGDLDGDGDLDLLVGENLGTILYFRNTGTRTAPVYVRQTGTNNPFNGVQMNFNSAVGLGDADGDGDLDAAVGQAARATLFYYKNTGTATAPVFTPQTGAANPFNEMMVTTKPYPSLRDLDGDGDVDALVGNESGLLNYFKNTPSPPPPPSSAFVLQGGVYPFSTLDLGTNSAPALGDLDGDGDLDMVYGRENGTLANYFKNTGTTTNPVYLIQQGTANPFNGFDVGDNSVPSLGDVDGDGDLDAVVGNFSGTLFYFKNTGTVTAPVYTPQTGTDNPFNGQDVGDNSAPSLGDVDGDGDIDAIVGAMDGRLRYYQNTNSVFVPQTGSANPFNLFTVGPRTAPSLGDLDGDGDLDAAVGKSDGLLNYFQNTGTATNPIYSLRTGTANLFNGLDVGFLSTPSLGDLDGDGDLDAVVGEFDGFLNYFKNTTPALVITQQSSPASQAVCAGGSASSTVAASGTGTLSYQWYRNQPNTTEPVPGQNTATLSLTNVQPADAGRYYCRVTNGTTTVFSTAFTLTVNPLPLVSIVGLASSFCKNAAAVPLAGSPAGGSFTIDGNAATSFDPATLAVGDHVVVYTYTNANSCSNSASQTVRVNALPVVSIVGLASSFCKDASAITLTGSPAGGSFTIDGNATTSFDPVSLAVGDHTVIYSYTDPSTTCSNTVSQTVRVNALPVVSITGLASSFCQNATAVPLVGNPAGGSFTIDGNAAASFDPASLAVGDHTVIYTYTDGNSCSNSASQTVTILQPVFSSPATVSGGMACAGTPVMLSFAVNCPDNASFTAELTTAAGFPLGSSLGSVSPGSQSVTIPAGTDTGSYKILITGSNPMMTSLSNAFSVTGLAANFNSTATVSQVPACAGASIRVSFTQQNSPACSFPLGNVFTAQLSDATGGFAAPVMLGSVSPGINTLTVPQNTPSGSGYRVRIAATTNGSAVYSAPSAAFTVNGPGFASTPTVSADNKCAGEAVRLSFGIGCAFFAGNVFIAQLSDKDGSFANSVNVGTVTPGALNNVTIPTGTPTGTGYKLRIVSSTPAVTSAASANFKVKACGGNNRKAAPEEVGLRVVVSPNPSPEGRLRISISGAEGQALRVELFNGTGQSLREQAIGWASAEETLTWDISRQPQGLYLLRVSGQRETRTIKILH